MLPLVIAAVIGWIVGGIVIVVALVALDHRKNK